MRVVFKVDKLDARNLLSIYSAKSLFGHSVSYRLYAADSETLEVDYKLPEFLKDRVVYHSPKIFKTPKSIAKSLYTEGIATLVIDPNKIYFASYTLPSWINLEEPKSVQYRKSLYCVTRADRAIKDHVDLSKVSKINRGFRECKDDRNDWDVIRYFVATQDIAELLNLRTVFHGGFDESE